MLKTIFAQKAKADLLAQWRPSQMPSLKAAKARHLIDGSRDNVLAYMALPREPAAVIGDPAVGVDDRAAVEQRAAADRAVDLLVSQHDPSGSRRSGAKITTPSYCTHRSGP